MFHLYIFDLDCSPALKYHYLKGIPQLVPIFKPSPTILSTGRDEPRPDVTPVVTPEVTPEVVADDVQTGFTAEESRRRRTRRFGGGGLVEEKGILSSSTGKRPTV